MIQTVLGQIAPEDLGLVACHEHLSLDLSHIKKEIDTRLKDRPLVLSELMKFADCGGNAFIEVSSADIGRDVEDLRYYSQASGVHIIASTGFYMAPYHPPFVQSSTVDQIAEYFVNELTVGIDNTEIKAGIIAEIATGNGCIHPNEGKVFMAAAKASRHTGCAISTHCEFATQGHEQLDILLGGGAAQDKIILGHMDLCTDTDYHLSLLRRGVNLAFDTIGKTAHISDQQRAHCLVKLLQDGWEDHLLISQDISRQSYFVANGGRGYTSVLKYFLPLLQGMGVSPVQINKLLKSNPARILNIDQ